MKISINATLLAPLKNILLQNTPQGYRANKLGTKGFSEVEGYDASFRNKDKVLGCNCGDEIIVCDTIEEVDACYKLGKIAVMRNVAEEMIAQGADILEE